jgi:hypothetical protein
VEFLLHLFGRAALGEDLHGQVGRDGEDLPLVRRDRLQPLTPV